MESRILLKNREEDSNAKLVSIGDDGEFDIQNVKCPFNSLMVSHVKEEVCFQDISASRFILWNVNKKVIRKVINCSDNGGNGVAGYGVNRINQVQIFMVSPMGCFFGWKVYREEEGTWSNWRFPRESLLERRFIPQILEGSQSILQQEGGSVIYWSGLVRDGKSILRLEVDSESLSFLKFPGKEFHLGYGCKGELAAISVEKEEPAVLKFLAFRNLNWVELFHIAADPLLKSMVSPLCSFMGSDDRLQFIVLIDSKSVGRVDANGKHEVLYGTPKLVSTSCLSDKKSLKKDSAFLGGERATKKRKTRSLLSFSFDENDEDDTTERMSVSLGNMC